MARLKVCIFGPSKRFLSGLSYYTIKLANALTLTLHNQNSASVSVSVITIRKLLPKFLFPGRRHVGKNLSNLDFTPSIKRCEIDWHSPITWFNAYKFIKKKDPDVLIFEWWSSSVAHLFLIFKLFNKLLLHKKIVLEFHEIVDPLEESILPIRLYSRLVGRILSRNAFAITHSEVDKSLITDKYRIPTRKIWVVPHGPYDQYKRMDKKEARRNLGIKEKEEFVILYFGLIREYKGVGYLIDAFNRIPGDKIENFRLLIIGEVWDDIGLEERKESSPYKEKIFIRDEYVSDEEVSVYFSAADVVVLPYLRASQSGVAHIAQTYKIPIIISEVGGLKESMSKYEGTIFVPPRDPEAIKDAILACFSSSSTMDIKVPELSWDLIAKRYEEIMEEICNL
jgi:glycosyltransferase involved in cell wall biosynthesis